MATMWRLGIVLLFRQQAGNLRAAYTNATFVGQGADASVSALSNVMALGAGASVTASNAVVIGNTSVTSIGGQVGFTTFSDRRLKTAIQKSELGLDFVMALNPVTYEYIAEGQKGIRYTGLIAQEVDAAAKGTFSGVDKNGEYWGIRYAELTVPLVSAVQELKMKNEALKNENTLLIKRLETIESMLTQYGNDLQACCFKSNDNNKTLPAFEGATLEQNVPNPFSQTTSISYYLPQNVANASMEITDLNGKFIQTHSLNDRGAAQITIDASTFAQGTYFYSLVIDGKIVATKKMVTVAK